MITPAEALKLIFENTPILPNETVPIGESADRVLAKELFAKNDLPPFDNSAMDGFAVRCADFFTDSKVIVFKVRETLKAGSMSNAQIYNGEAIKIMTGAPLPKGADAVVMKELTSCDKSEQIHILKNPRMGENIRHKGEDVKRGDLLLNKGILIRPYEIALLASQGLTQVQVTKKARVSILATGDELLDYSEKLTPGKIRNSNGPALTSAISRWGAKVQDEGIVKDDPGLLKKKIEVCLEKSDLLLVCGGVSVGDFDYTKNVLEKCGMKVIFWKVAIKPGKPLLFGMLQNRIIFGLPGNPVAALVCAEEFVRPAIEKLQGLTPSHPSYHLKGVVINEYHKHASRQQYIFCQVSSGAEGYKIQIIKPQGSAMVGMVTKANALAVSPIGPRFIKPGDPLQFRWLK